MIKTIIYIIIIFTISYTIWYISATKYLLDKYYICELKVDNIFKCSYNYKDDYFKINK